MGMVYFGDGFNPMSSVAQCAHKLAEYLYLTLEMRGKRCWDSFFPEAALTCTSLKVLWTMSLRGYDHVMILERSPVQVRRVIVNRVALRRRSENEGMKN